MLADGIKSRRRNFSLLLPDRDADICFAIVPPFVACDDSGLGAKNNMTPLLWTALCGQPEVVKYLVAQGADVNAMEKNGGTPLSIAVAIGKVDVVEFLKPHSAKE